MAERSLKTVADWYNAQLDANGMVEITGDLSTLLDNQYPNPFLRDIGPLGEPVGTEVAMPPRIVGHNVYFSEVSPATTFIATESTNTFTADNHGFDNNEVIRLTGSVPAPLIAEKAYFVRNPTNNTFQLSATRAGSIINITTGGSGEVVQDKAPDVSTLTRQNAAPWPLENPSWVGSQPIITKSLKPPTGSRLADIPQAQAPVYDTEPTDEQGYAEGWYGFLWDAETKDGKRTRPSGMTVFPVGQGQIIEVPLPSSIPEGATSIGLYLTLPAPDKENVNPATARRQRVVRIKSLRLPVIELTGPWRAGRPPSDRNETALGAVPAPRGGDIRKTHGRFNLVAGSYMFAVQPISDIGPGKVGKTSRIRKILGDKNPKFEEGGGGGGEEGEEPENNGPEFFSYQKHQMFTFKPHTWPKGMVGWVPWVWQDGLWYRVHRAHSRVGAEDIIRTRSERPEIYGSSEDSSGELAGGGGEGGGRPGSGGIQRWVMVQSEPPAEDESGLEDPDPFAESDPPVAKGATVPIPGDYWVSITDVTEEGQESPASPPILVHVSFGTMPRITFLNSVQLLPNAEGMERNASGLPTHWDVDQSGGSYRWDGGAHILATTGTVTSANTAPSIESQQFIPIDLQSSYTAKGVLVVPTHVSGTARVALRQFDDAGNVLSNIVLASATSVGQVEFETIVDPAQFDPACAQVKMKAFMPTGSDRNLEMQVSELLLSPGVAPPERVVLKPNNSHEPADFGPPVTEPYPQQAFFAVGPPKPKPGASTNPLPPVEERDFESGAPGNANWSAITSNGGNIVLSSSDPLRDTQHLKASNATSGNKATAYIRRSYAGEVDGGALAAHFLFRVRDFPNTNKVANAHVVIHEIRLSADEPGVQLLITNKKKLLLRFYDNAGNFEQRTLLPLMYLNTVYDIEVLVGGGDSRNGVARVLIGTHGNARTEIGSISGQNILGHNPRVVRLGGSEETHASTTWDFEYDNLVVTTTGDASHTNSVPPIGTPPSPDRPLKAEAAPWLADTDYAVGDTVLPNTSNGHVYVATVAGTSHATTEPTFPETSLATVTDNTVTWREHGTIYREVDPDGEESYQLALYLPEETVVSDTLGPRLGHTDDSPAIAVKPGQTYTLSVFTRYKRGTTDAVPARPFHVTLHNAAGDIVSKGSPYDTLAEGGIVGSRGWAEDVLEFTVDEGFTEMRIQSLAMGEGYYKWQDPLLSEGTYASQAVRAGLRTYGCRVLSVATALIDGRTPQDANPFGVQLEHGWLASGIRENEDIPEGAPTAFTATASDDTFTVINHRYKDGGVIQFTGDSLPTPLELETDYYVRDVSLDTFKVSETPGGAALDLTADGSGNVVGVAKVSKRFRSASDEAATVWSSWFDEPTDVPVGKWLEAEATLRSDGRVRPVVPARGVFLRTNPFTANVLKADRSAIPGGAMIKGLELPPVRPDWEVVRVGGTTYATDLSEAVMVLPNCELRAFSAEAKKFLEELAPDDEFIIEAPHAAADGTGVVMIARTAQVIDFERTGYYHLREGMRFGYYTIELEAAEILELATLE